MRSSGRERLDAVHSMDEEAMTIVVDPQLNFLDPITAWKIQTTYALAHHARCSATPGWNPISGPRLLCDCGAVEATWRRLKELAGDRVARLPGKPFWGHHGHRAYYGVDHNYHYLDTGEVVDFLDCSRPCGACGLEFDPQDPVDPCIGRLPGVKNACCGHGQQIHGADTECEAAAYIQFTNGITIYFDGHEMEVLKK